MSESTSWWAVQVRAAREQLAATHLRSRGYEVFLPCYPERRRWSDRVKEIERPLFAGYLFCCVTRTVVGKIVTAPAVVRIVGDERGPVAIQDSEILAVRRIVETHLVASPWRYIERGQTVRVEVGPLRGLEGIVLGTKGDRRLIVSIPLLRQSVAVELDTDSISVPSSSLVAGAGSQSAA